jgi:hypothetical protein
MTTTNLGDVWRVRNAAAQTLALAEDQVKRVIQAATVDELVRMIEGYSPALSTGPEFTRTFDPLVERLWAWRDDQTLAALAAVFKERGPPWASVVNAFLPENGAAIRTALRQPAWARLPAFAIS